MLKARKRDVFARPFAAWRIVAWLVMLLAAVGFVINAYIAVLSGGAIHDLTPEAIADGPDPRIALAWALAYTIAAFAIMAISLSTLRWREWARRAMRVVAPLLMVWAAYTAWVSFEQWQQIGAVLGQPGLPPELLALGEKRRTILLAGLLLKVVSIPVLGWMAWALGTVPVRQQFARTAL